MILSSHLLSVAFGSEWDIPDTATQMIDVVLGSSALIPCNPPPANHAPNVVWLRNGAVLNTGNAGKYKVLMRSGDLVIGNVDSTDVTGTYRCRVTNKNLYDTMNSPHSYQLNTIG